MEKFNKIIYDLVVKLEMISYNGDLSDIGNEIGMVIGRHIKKNVPGCELDDLLNGIKHGISLSNNSHPLIK